MKLSEFDFELPAESVAQYPVEPRESAKLLHVSASSQIFEDYRIFNLPELLRPDDLLVFNDTRVIPARLRGKRDEVKVEVTLHKPMTAELCWEVFAKPARKLKIGQTVIFSENLSAEVVEKTPEGTVVLKFLCEGEFFSCLEQAGEMPLPPYIKRDAAKKADDEHYQTAFAKHPGAVAAPTAGLHFTDKLFKAFKARDIEHCFVTLHVGGGTFLPVKTDNVHEHVMHSEQVQITQEIAEKITNARKSGRRIVAVGTTSLRSLEAATDEHGITHSMQGDTDIFITPGYRFKGVDAMVTNFHLPKSTLFMLVSAFCGKERMLSAYNHAIVHDYRFFSYGDACLLEKNELS